MSLTETVPPPISFEARTLAKVIVTLEGERSIDQIIDSIGDAKLVLIGEASHGTHEFYQLRAELTKRLIERKGFSMVAVEADWPDALRVNDFVQQSGNDRTAEQALAGFARFPTWMWRNKDVVDFVNWLRTYNDAHSNRMVGFYGLDLYSLYASISEVIKYLDETDPAAARRARFRYSCLEHYGEDPQSYGYAATFGITRSCEEHVVAQLNELHTKRVEASQERVKKTAQKDIHSLFYAEQNARLAVHAEEYYRSMFSRSISSWNIRDRHMAETLDELILHLTKNNVDGTESEIRAVVWEHNSHLGDASATERAAENEVNVGQLVRQRYGTDACLVGFTSYTGWVTAADNWDEPPQRKKVCEALKGSYEDLFHDVCEYLSRKGKPSEVCNFWIDLRAFDRPSSKTAKLANSDVANILGLPRLERAIGVIYRPETERVSHYFYSILPRQFDIVIHLDETTALLPLDAGPEWNQREPHGEPPETYPSGL